MKEEKKTGAEEESFARVEIIIDMRRLTSLLKRLSREGLTSGVTVFQALGCGIQKGSYEYEEASGQSKGDDDIQLLPKTMLLIVCEKSKVRKLIETVKLELYTGHIGDGKIFVSDIGNAVRVRTGEEGLAAISQSQVR